MKLEKRLGYNYVLHNYKYLRKLSFSKKLEINKYDAFLFKIFFHYYYADTTCEFVTFYKYNSFFEPISYNFRFFYGF